MELYQIRYFLAVAETGGFTKGAERAFVSQPTLSAGVAKLEAELGIRLFERNSKGAALNAAGRRFLDRARVIVGECNAAKAELVEVEEQRRLRLGSLRTIPAVRLGRLMGDFRKAYPDVRIELREGTLETLAGWLGRGRIDMALTVLDGEPDRDQSQVLYRTKYVLLVAGGHPFARRKSVRLAELHDQPFIVRTHCETMSEAKRLFAEQQVRPKIVCRTDQDERAIALVEEDFGLAIVPDLFSAPKIVQLPIIGLSLNRTIGLHWINETKDEALDLFRTFAASHDWRPEGAVS